MYWNETYTHEKCGGFLLLKRRQYSCRQCFKEGYPIVTNAQNNEAKLVKKSVYEKAAVSMKELEDVAINEQDMPETTVSSLTCADCSKDFFLTEEFKAVLTKFPLWKYPAMRPQSFMFTPGGGVITEQATKVVCPDCSAKKAEQFPEP